MASLDRRFKRQPTEKKIKLAPSDWAKQCDVYCFGGSGDMLGHVVTKASPAGQQAVEKLFPPGIIIKWRPIEAPDDKLFPSDWGEFDFVVPSIMHIPGNKLRLELLSDTGISTEKMIPDQFAFLMAISAKHQGARAAMWSERDKQLKQFNPAAN